jgi:hypothetical protein
MATYDLNGPFNAGDTGVTSTINGTITIGGELNVFAMSNDSVNVGSYNSTITLSGNGSVNIGGYALVPSVLGAGNVCIASECALGSNSSDQNLVVVGGYGTTLTGQNSVAIGPSQLVKLFNPTRWKLYLMDNPVSTRAETVFTTPGTLTAASLSDGYVVFTTTSGAYTLPTTSDLCIEIIDTAQTAFADPTRYTFSTTFSNTSGGTITLASNTGQTFTNFSSPLSLSNGSSVTLTFTFTSVSTLSVELSSSPPSYVSSVTGTTNQVTASPTTGNVVVGLPNNVTINSSLTVSGLTANSFLYSGTAGLLTTTSAPTNGQLLIGSTGTAPVAASLTSGGGMNITTGAGSVTVSVLEPFFTTNSRAIIAGLTNTNTAVSSTSSGAVVGGASNTNTIIASSGGVIIGGRSNAASISGSTSSGGVNIGGYRENGDRGCGWRCCDRCWWYCGCNCRYEYGAHRWKWDYNQRKFSMYRSTDDDIHVQSQWQRQVDLERQSCQRRYTDHLYHTGYTHGSRSEWRICSIQHNRRCLYTSHNSTTSSCHRRFIFRWECVSTFQCDVLQQHRQCVHCCSWYRTIIHKRHISNLYLHGTIENMVILVHINNDHAD